MKLYKSPKNEIYAYESDGSQDHLISKDFVLVTQEEANVVIAENQQKLLDEEKIIFDKL